MNLTITITRHSACRKGRFCAVEREQSQPLISRISNWSATAYDAGNLGSCFAIASSIFVQSAAHVIRPIILQKSGPIGTAKCFASEQLKISYRASYASRVDVIAISNDNRDAFHRNFDAITRPGFVQLRYRYERQLAFRSHSVVRILREFYSRMEEIYSHQYQKNEMFAT